MWAQWTTKSAGVSFTAIATAISTPALTGRSPNAAIAVSASGNSPNVVRACEYVREIGGRLIVLAGFAGGAIAPMAGAALVTACYVRFAHTRGSLAAFHHAGWLLTGGAVLLALCALFMVNHSTLTTQVE